MSSNIKPAAEQEVEQHIRRKVMNEGKRFYRKRHAFTSPPCRKTGCDLYHGTYSGVKSPRQPSGFNLIPFT